VRFATLLATLATEYTGWQWPLSDVHTSMIEKLAQAGEGERTPPFTISSITYKVVVYAPAERADTLPLLLLYPYLYSMTLATGLKLLYSITLHRVQSENIIK
jgi:hypothetical protein